MRLRKYDRALAYRVKYHKMLLLATRKRGEDLQIEERIAMESHNAFIDAAENSRRRLRELEGKLANYRSPRLSRRSRVMRLTSLRRKEAQLRREVMRGQLKLAAVYGHRAHMLRMQHKMHVVNEFELLGRRILRIMRKTR